MGTNYFHRTNICDCCGRYDEDHICKTLVSFAAPVRWGVDAEPSVLVASWREWKERLLAGGEVWDEYGQQYTVVDFIDRVEATDPDARRRQFNWVCAHEPRLAADKPRPYSYWLDPDGFSFYGGEFS